MAARVLLIESARANAPSFALALRKRGYDLWQAHSGKEAVHLLTLEGAPPEVIVLDAASLRTSGNRICAQLRSHFGEIPIIHIKAASENGTPSEANVVLYMTFTARKLINRIEQFLNIDKGEILECGLFKLNLKHRVLSANGKETRLTPKLAQLMEAFLRNPGEVLEREHLIRTVWETDYMGDTRTLDVHIRWIREAVESEAGQPRHVLTVRGVGYRFDPDPDQLNGSH